MSITRWTELQFQAVVKRVLERMTEDTTLSIPNALWEAQNVYVPKIERMSISTCSQYLNHSKRLRAALEAAGVVYPNRALGRTAGTLDTVKHREFLARFGIIVKHESEPKLEPKLEPATSTVQSSKPEAERLYTLNEARQIFQGEFMAVLKDEVGREVRRLLGESEPNPESLTLEMEVSKSLPVVKIKVLITGTFAEQQQKLMRIVGTEPRFESLEIKFWDDDGTNKLKAALAWADVVVQLTRFSKHQYNNYLQAHPRLERVSGGYSSTLAMLESISVRQ